MNQQNYANQYAFNIFCSLVFCFNFFVYGTLDPTKNDEEDPPMIIPGQALEKRRRFTALGVAEISPGAAEIKAATDIKGTARFNSVNNVGSLPAKCAPKRGQTMGALGETSSRPGFHRSQTSSYTIISNLQTKTTKIICFYVFLLMECQTNIFLGWRRMRQ